MHGMATEKVAALVSSIGGPLGLCRYCAKNNPNPNPKAPCIVQYLHNPSGPPKHETMAEKAALTTLIYVGDCHGVSKATSIQLVHLLQHTHVHITVIYMYSVLNKALRSMEQRGVDHVPTTIIVFLVHVITTMRTVGAGRVSVLTQRGVGVDGLCPQSLDCNW